jgi:arsenical pump membrane protein
VVFGSNLPSLGQWLMRFVFPSVLSIVATLLILQWVFRSELRGAIEQRIEASPLTRHGRMVVVGLALTVAGLLIASAFDRDLGLPTCLIAVVVAAIVCGLARKNPLPLLREISWSTLALVAGLFVLVEAIVGVGGLKYTQAWLEKAQGMGVAAGTFVTGICVGVANNVVNNLPLGLIAGSTLRATHATRLISSAVLIGVDVGPNLAITGSLATILWLIALRKERLDVSFWSFFKVGVIAMPVALLSSLAGALAMEWLMRNI